MYLNVPRGYGSQRFSVLMRSVFDLIPTYLAVSTAKPAQIQQIGSKLTVLVKSRMALTKSFFFLQILIETHSPHFCSKSFNNLLLGERRYYDGNSLLPHSRYAI